MGEDNPKDGSEDKVTTQVTKATEQQKKEARRQTNELDNRYGKIGISAVAAAVRQKGEKQTVSEYRIPYDRD